MKRRLDLALALVHGPRDPLPRRADDRPRHPEPHRALGRGRAPRRRGGRHRLPHHPVPGGGRRARRPGRDHRPRPDRRRGHAGRAEGRDRPARRSRATPRESTAERPVLGVLAALRRARPAASPTRCAVRLEGGEAQLAEVVRALDAEGIAIEHLQLHAPSLDDVFLAKTGRSLEGAGDEARAEDVPRPRRRRPRARRLSQAGPRAPRSGSSPAARSCAPCASRRRSSPR